MLSMTTIPNIPQMFCWGPVWRACRPEQHVDVVVSKEGFYDSGCMGSGVAMLMNDTTWLLLERRLDGRTQNVIDWTLSCRVSVNDDQWCPLLPTDPSGATTPPPPSGTTF